jgi:hypothetical protein
MEEIGTVRIALEQFAAEQTDPAVRFYLPASNSDWRLRLTAT